MLGKLASIRRDSLLGLLMKLAGTCCALALAGFAANPTAAQTAAQSVSTLPIIKYRTREEKREAGLSHVVAPWLTFSGVVESEFITEETGFKHRKRHKHNVIDPAVQLNMEFSPHESVEAELILEYTEDAKDPLLDELIVGWNGERVGLSTGRYYLPFGEYYSNFINGPLLEFSQTRADVLQLDYDYDEQWQLSLFAFKGKARAVTNNSPVHWGASGETRFGGSHFKLGGGYLSHLADSDWQPLAAGQRYRAEVGAWNAYLIGEWQHGGFSLEKVASRQRLQELERAEDQPAAYNVEAVLFVYPTLELGLRYERGQELSDEVQRRSGIELTWRPSPRLSITAEYLRGHFRALPLALLADAEVDYDEVDYDEVARPEPVANEEEVLAVSFSLSF
jgi:hypothetical protein